LSPELAKALAAGLLDVAFLRREANVSGIAYRDLIREKLLVILRADDKLAAHRRIRPSHLRGRTLIGVPMATAPVLRTVLDAYAAEAGIDLTPQHQADNVSMTISLVASTRGVALLPEFARRLLPASVVSRPLAASEPTIELVLGYSSASRSPLLKLLLARTDELVRYAAGAA
jgi:LysR family hca operon transcriptional activator